MKTNETKEITLIITNSKGEDVQKKYTLRKPYAGEMRGIKLIDVFTMDVAAYEKLLPRISTPTIDAATLNQMDLSSLSDIAEVVSSFFDKEATLTA